jgi:molybdate transport system ATP-binding protein
MLIKTLAAGAALSMLVVGGSALAQTSARTSATTGPKEPIPYSQLNAYLKASPKARASKDWWSADASAATGASTDTSATAPMTSGTMSGDAKASTSTDTSVNPPNAMPTTPPTLPDSVVPPTPDSNLPAPTLPPVPPK